MERSAPLVGFVALQNARHRGGHIHRGDHRDVIGVSADESTWAACLLLRKQCQEVKEFFAVPPELNIPDGVSPVAVVPVLMLATIADAGDTAAAVETAFALDPGNTADRALVLSLTCIVISRHVQGFLQDKLERQPQWSTASTSTDAQCTRLKHEHALYSHCSLKRSCACTVR